LKIIKLKKSNKNLKKEKEKEKRERERERESRGAWATSLAGLEWLNHPHGPKNNKIKKLKIKKV
jgi:hypothetical protein